MIRYRFAFGTSGSVVDVVSLTPETRHDLSPYACPGCGRELIANLGMKKVNYFSHKIADRCNAETYLHSLGKHAFFSEYWKCIDEGTPFVVRQKVPGECNREYELLGGTCTLEKVREHDLTRYFRKASLETPIDGIIPDVLLTSEDGKEQLFVEVAVTHKCEPEKIARGTRIIEIDLSEEADLQIFEDHSLSEDDERVTLFNFEKVPIRGDICGGSCPKSLRLFLVYPSGKAHLGWHQISEARKILANKKLLRGEILGPWPPADPFEDVSALFVEKVREALFDGIAVKNCFNCRYQGLGRFPQRIFCKLRKVGVRSNEAAGCRTYRPFGRRAEADQADKANAEYTRR